MATITSTPTADSLTDGGLTGHTVTFVDWDGTILKTELVEDGGSATAPSNPTRTDYIFIGWDVDFSNVTSNLTITAQYIDAGGSDVKKNLFPSFKNEWTLDSYDLVYLIAYDDYSAEITINDSNTGLKSSNISKIQGKTIRLGVKEFYGTSSKMMLYYTDGSCEDKIIDKDNTEVTINVQDKPCYLYILDTENNNLTTLYDAYLYIEGDSSEEPEEDIIEWTGTGTVATGLNSGIKHSNYKINLDWDNEYFDIILQNYTQTGNGVADTKVCSVRINNNTYDCYFEEKDRINNNTYDYYFEEKDRIARTMSAWTNYSITATCSGGRIALRQGSIDICECYSNVLPSTLRFAKDGIYCLYEEENVKIGEIEYGDDNVIYILEDDEYSTDFNMNFNLAISERSSEDIEPEIKQLSLGNLKIDKLYIGETEVTEIYLGEVLVYRN